MFDARALVLLFRAPLGCDRPASASVQREPRGAAAQEASSALQARQGDTPDAPSPDETPPKAPPPARPPQTACPKFNAGVASGRVASRDIDETSGLVASRRHADVLWLHNDSGDGARVFAVDPAGTLLGIFTLPTVEAIDWEDIAVGPGPRADQSYLYIADIGDNGRRRKEGVFLYRVPEPPLTATPEEPARGHLGPLERFRLRYPDGPHDAETLLVDPTTGEVVVLTKALFRTPRIFYVDVLDKPLATFEGGEPLDLEAAGIRALLPTGGDVSADGRWVLVRSYRSAYLWQRAEGQRLRDVFRSRACPVPVAAEVQGEAIGFSADGRSYYTVSEGRHPTVYHYTRPSE
jgi:hypothetical protein